ncbi:uncharacterized protein KY384_002854 [Bacidia gigantensis]|uniref:uncharacterized protein n=1 Tax=Bacidia gigantensis TaxID=2732470 RepID=UPI001D052C12|nr:uncharacterized protein KY384_002854 [Bacidia gigantensis]KAG8532369.1 hypothetical protein KY384_002854 [Bacidia gigantensis]
MAIAVRRPWLVDAGTRHSLESLRWPNQERWIIDHIELVYQEGWLGDVKYRWNGISLMPRLPKFPEWNVRYRENRDNFTHISSVSCVIQTEYIQKLHSFPLSLPFVPSLSTVLESNTLPTPPSSRLSATYKKYDKVHGKVSYNSNDPGKGKSRQVT